MLCARERTNPCDPPQCHADAAQVSSLRVSKFKIDCGVYIGDMPYSGTQFAHRHDAGNTIRSEQSSAQKQDGFSTVSEGFEAA
jgi:hypothetical protein